MKTTYPVLLTKTENCILVEVPYFDILTEGTDYTNAIEMARDAIGLTGISMEDHKKTNSISFCSDRYLRRRRNLF